MTTKTLTTYVARMYGIGASEHKTLEAAKRGLAKLRKAYRESRASMPYPRQTIEHNGKTVYGV